MKLVSSALLLSLGIAACTTVGQPFVAMLGKTPAVSGGKYSSGGGLSVAADVRELDGRTLICGVWAQSRQQSVLTKGVAPRVIATGSVLLGEERLIQNLLFMREIPPMADYGGQEAECILTERPWQPADTNRPLSIRIPRQQVVREDSELGAFIITFTQTGPGAGN